MTYNEGTYGSERKIYFRLFFIDSRIDFPIGRILEHLSGGVIIGEMSETEITGRDFLLFCPGSRGSTGSQ